MRITLGLFSGLLMIIPRFPCMGLCKSLFFDYCVAILGIDVFLILYHKIANLSIIKWQKGAAEATPFADLIITCTKRAKRKERFVFLVCFFFGIFHRITAKGNNIAFYSIINAQYCTFVLSILCFSIVIGK